MEVRAPGVTVGLPVYNGERFLRETLASVLSQDLPPTRIVISDNCSEDGTQDICRALQAEHPNITYIRQARNVGAIRNFEIVMEACETEFFAWIGDHDLWSANYLSSLVAALKDRPRCVLAYPDVTRIDVHGNVIEAGCSPDRWSTESMDPQSRLRTVLWRRKTAFMIYGVARAQALQRVRVPRIQGPDNLVLCELALLGEFAFTPEATFFYRELRDAETVEQMWERQRTDLRVQGSGRPLWRVFFEIVKLVARTSQLTLAQKLRALDETVWSFEMRTHAPLRAESPLLGRALHAVNWVFSRFRGTRTPGW